MQQAFRVVACASAVLLMVGASALPSSALAFSLKNGDVGWDGSGLGSATLTYWVDDTPDLENESEIIALLAEGAPFHPDGSPASCPHGRPVAWVVTHEEIARRVGR